MRNVRLPGAHRSRRAPAWIMLGLTILAAGSALSCGSDEAAGPSAAISGAPSAQSADVKTIVVTTAAELVAALSPENGGRRIVVQAGTYAIDALLTVPDGATLEGEGVMQFDGAGLPTGFASGTSTTLTMTVTTPGNLLTLGDGVTILRRPWVGATTGVRWSPHRWTGKSLGFADRYTCIRDSKAAQTRRQTGGSPTEPPC